MWTKDAPHLSCPNASGALHLERWFSFRKIGDSCRPGRWPQVEALGPGAGYPPSLEEVEEVFLSRLAEGEAVESEVVLDGNDLG